MSRLFGGTSTVQATGRFLRRQIWAWPIIAAVLFGGSGFWVHKTVEDAMRDQRAADLNTLVDASVTTVRVWVNEQLFSVQRIAEDEKLSLWVAELLLLADGSPMSGRNLVQSKIQEALRARLMQKFRGSGFVGYFIVSPAGVVVAADQDPPIGNELAGYRGAIFEEALKGASLVSKPFRSPLLLSDEDGELRANLPSMFAIGSLRDGKGRPIAALGLRIRPEDQFSRVLQIVRFGQSGETYAFDERGLLLSESRFDDSLKEIGLLVDQSDARSTLTLELRDPQVDLTEGHRSALRRAEQPLTRLAADAVQGRDGYDADGYRNYRGVPVVGAWRWLADFDLGIGTEVEVAEAFRPVYILRSAFWGLMSLLVLSALGMFLAMTFIARQQRALQTATLAARQLGQYALEEKLGAGGMGTVYRARHAMLRRPTAVKLLDIDKGSDAAITRFEREVQLTSALTHPNTVAVYDFGRTSDGIFYYAMEYLDGMNLDDLIRRHGPVTEARLVFLLRQVCGSLAEAHAQGLVHRDIKPANIFLTRRGGLFDFVKVLDFGLVKSLDGTDKANVTSPHALMGTPLYLSPEAVNHPEGVDARADVYAVGAVGYFMLTGSPLFTGATIMEICLKHVKEPPEPPSVRSGKSFSPDLEALLLRCLAKSPADRPADAAELLRDLESCSLAESWTATAAAIWWSERGDVESTQIFATPDARSMNAAGTPTVDSTMAYQLPTG